MSRILPAGLLVSVRTADEAEEAIAGGAAIIDVKEPKRGPLGCADAAVAIEIGEVIAGRAAWTLACGELAGGWRLIAEHVGEVVRRRTARGATLAAVKAGPAGLSIRAWTEAFGALSHALGDGPNLVPVVYADWEAASAPTPTAVIAASAAAGATTLLIDTFDKRSPGIASCPGASTVAAWVRDASAAGIRVALAGRLAARDLPVFAALGAAVLGVRSAACEGGRLGRVERGKVASLVGTLTPTPVVAGSIEGMP